MTHRNKDNVEHSFRMIRHYADQLSVYADDGGTFTSQEVQELQTVIDVLDNLHEPTTDTSGSGETGGNAQNP